jgi:hypothetical protein
MKLNGNKMNPVQTDHSRSYMDMSPDFVFISDLVRFDRLNR